MSMLFSNLSNQKGGKSVIYQNVINYCSKNNISICDFEKKCGIGNGTVGRWKDNSSKPTVATLEKIADATKIPIDKWLK